MGEFMTKQELAYKVRVLAQEICFALDPGEVGHEDPENMEPGDWLTIRDSILDLNDLVLDSLEDDDDSPFREPEQNDEDYEYDLEVELEDDDESSRG